MGAGRLGDGVCDGSNQENAVSSGSTTYMITMTGGRYADTLPHLTTLILSRLRPLADPTSPVAPHGGNGPIVIVRVRRD
jgi:hypothetical protein